MAIGEIVSETEGGVIVVSLRGEHDLSTAPAVRDEIDRAIAAANGIVVDMTGADFIDSSILGVLVEGYRATAGDADAARGFAVAAVPGGPVTRLLDLVAVSDLVRVYPTRSEALAAVCGE